MKPLKRFTPPVVEVLGKVPLQVKLMAHALAKAGSRVVAVVCDCDGVTVGRKQGDAVSVELRAGWGERGEDVWTVRTDRASICPMVPRKEALGWVAEWAR